MHVHSLPDNTAPDGTFCVDMSRLRELKQELKDSAGGDDWSWDWLDR